MSSAAGRQRRCWGGGNRNSPVVTAYAWPNRSFRASDSPAALSAVWLTHRHSKRDRAALNQTQSDNGIKPNLPPSSCSAYYFLHAPRCEPSLHFNFHLLITAINEHMAHSERLPGAEIFAGEKSKTQTVEMNKSLFLENQEVFRIKRAGCSAALSGVATETRSPLCSPVECGVSGLWP